MPDQRRFQTQTLSRIDRVRGSPYPVPGRKLLILQVLPPGDGVERIPLLHPIFTGQRRRRWRPLRGRHRRQLAAGYDRCGAARAATRDDEQRERQRQYPQSPAHHDRCIRTLVRRDDSGASSPGFLTRPTANSMETIEINRLAPIIGWQQIERLSYSVFHLTQLRILSDPPQAMTGLARMFHPGTRSSRCEGALIGTR